MINNLMLNRQKEIEKKFKKFLIVPAKLTNLGKLILTVRDRLLKNSRKVSGIGLIRSPAEELDIEVSASNIIRAILFMDTLIKLFEARGHEVIEQNGTFVLIDDVKLKISLREKRNRRLYKDKTNWTTAEFTPNGILSFKMRDFPYKPFEWKDGRRPIEKQLSNILAFAELKAKEIKEKELESEKRWVEWEIQRRMKQVFEEKKSQELASFKELLQQARRWHEATFIREYIDAVKREAASDTDIQAWAEWGKRKADWYDPTINIKDELLEGVDKSSLQLPASFFKD